MNESIFNMYTDSLCVEDINSNKSLSEIGNTFSTIIPMTSLPLLALGATVLIRITNPSTSMKVIYLSNIIISHTNLILNLTVTVYGNGSFTGGGTALTTVNNNTGSTKSSSATVAYIINGTRVGDKVLLQKPQTEAVSSSVLNSTISIAPNTTLLITVYSPVTLIISDSIGVTISWVE